MRPDSEVKNAHTLQSKNNESEQLKAFFLFLCTQQFHHIVFVKQVRVPV